MIKKYFLLVFVFFFLHNIYSQTTAIPDENFEQALIDLGVDSDGTINQSVLTSDISGITHLSVGYQNISDLTGIEGFTDLTSLSCTGNSLTSLDLSANTNLTSLTCAVNALTSLDVSANTKLTYLSCANNFLTSLDLSANTGLTFLSCRLNNLTSLDLTANTDLTSLLCQFNFLTSLDLSANTGLITLSCMINQLTSLDLSANTDLQFLYFSHNQLTYLDVSTNTSLRKLDCSVNQLTSLDVKNGNNTILTNFQAQNNPDLTCVQVDNETNANAGTGVYASWDKDATATYSEDCGYTLNIEDELLAKGLNLYPNPVTNILSVDSEIPLTKVEIYSILGKKVKEVNSDFNFIPTDNLSNGVYIVRVHSENGIATKKLIKK